MRAPPLTALLVTLAGATLTPTAHAQAPGLEVGLLTCTVVPGSRVNLVVRSTADVICEYTKGGAAEHYIGETGIALGVDLSFRSDERMAFSVLSASRDIAPGSNVLVGKYVGGELSAAAGLGLGAKALLGGGAKNVGLQPIALESSRGLGASGGLSLSLHRARAAALAGPLAPQEMARAADTHKVSGGVRPCAYAFYR